MKKTPDIMTIDGREYLRELLYREVSEYYPYELKRCIEDGMLFMWVQAGDKKHRYFNLEDCEKWHRGEYVA